jgi:hypothetical protein
MDTSQGNHLSCSLGSTRRDSMNALFLLITAESKGRGGGRREKGRRGETKCSSAESVRGNEERIKERALSHPTI